MSKKHFGPHKSIFLAKSLVILRKWCTFAFMNETKKRKIASLLLLAVFLPMLLVSSLHIHPSYESAETECAECVNHNCAGHITQQAIGMHQCVLCQFLTLPMLIVTVFSVIIYKEVKRLLRDSRHSSLNYALRGVIALRAPPISLQ